MPQPLRVHPQNPKLFEFRGRPRVLLTATEHYGAVMNRPFQFERYLADAAEKRMTLTRLFTLFRELQTPINPYSTCKPELPDYIAPFARTGPGRALDGELKYDLDRPNPEFFDRLQRFMTLASDYASSSKWSCSATPMRRPFGTLNPLNARNNINGLEEIEWPDYVSQRHPRLFERQAAHVRRIVEAVNPFDNVLLEICNEPGGGVAGNPLNPSPAEVNRWLEALIAVVRATEAGLPMQHVIAGQEAFTYQPSQHTSEKAFRSMDYDVRQYAPAAELTFNGRSYDLGDFMSKQLPCARCETMAWQLMPSPSP